MYSTPVAPPTGFIVAPVNKSQLSAELPVKRRRSAEQIIRNTLPHNDLHQRETNRTILTRFRYPPYSSSWKHSPLQSQSHDGHGNWARSAHPYVFPLLNAHLFSFRTVPILRLKFLSSLSHSGMPDLLIRSARVPSSAFLSPPS